MPGTLERQNYLEGLQIELANQFGRYNELLIEYSRLLGQLEVAERGVVLSRDHLLASIDCRDMENGDVCPQCMPELVGSIRFTGTRVAEAALTVLRENGTLDSDEMVAALNAGGFRFRTPTPMRELHAALLQQRRLVKRVGDQWTYIGKEEGESKSA